MPTTHVWTGQAGRRRSGKRSFDRGRPVLIALPFLLALCASTVIAEARDSGALTFSSDIRFLLETYGYDCDGPEGEAKGDGWLSKCGSPQAVARDQETWQTVADGLFFKEVPPNEAERELPGGTEEAATVD